MTISAKIVAYSISHWNTEIITYELEYPRFIHAELMTHRVFSRNAASSRAIPVKRSIELIKENTAMPVHWGKNQPGMSAKEENEALIAIFDLDHFEDLTHNEAWAAARDQAIKFASAFDSAGYHKQIVNRILEPFSHIKVVVTSTEWNNWFALRNHADAQPEIKELAHQMWLERARTNVVPLRQNEWHVPYFQDGYWLEQDGFGLLEDAIAISASCCAQVSYRRLDDSLEKAREIYSRLVDSKPVHASPFEHQATPISGDDFQDIREWREIPGVTHQDRDGILWSGNLRHWIQNRQLMPGNVVSG
jgi:thymidylate synthase ThyX